MMARLLRALGWLLTAVSVWGLFRLAAALPPDGYGLRFAEPLSPAQTDALRRAAGEQGLDLTLWREEEILLTTGTGRSCKARLLTLNGDPWLAFPSNYCVGTAPGAEQWDGCAVSGPLADALFGSRKANGLVLDVNDSPRHITGVLESEGEFLLCPESADGGMGYTAAALGGIATGDPRGTVQAILQSAGLTADTVTMLPYATLRLVLTWLAWLPLVTAGLRLARQVWHGLQLSRGVQWLAGFGIAVTAALLLPAGLALLPRWLIPSRWSDPGFWTGLADTLWGTLQCFLHLPNTVPEQRLARQLLTAAGCLAGFMLGALILSESTVNRHPCRHRQTKEKPSSDG